MEKIALNFVLEFARDLQKLLEILDKEFGQNLVRGNAYQRKKIEKRASELTLALYNNYRGNLDLSIQQNTDFNELIFSDYSGIIYKIPTLFYESYNFYILFSKYKNLVHLSEIGISDWDFFKQSLVNIFVFVNQKSRLLNRNTLEKIRFFMTFINEFPNFDFENFPAESLEKFYIPKYSNWRKNRSYTYNYKKYIRITSNFFSNHVNINLIPNYKRWHLNLVFFDQKDIPILQNFSDLHYFPIQIFENPDSSINSIIAVISPRLNQPELKKFKIEEFSIINNFNIFQKMNKNKKSFYPKQTSFFDSYVEFFDELQNGVESHIESLTYEFSINFQTAEESSDRLLPYTTQKTIKSYNLSPRRELSKFYSLYDKHYKNTNPYHYLFSRRFTFPDFNSLDNYLLILKKKKRNIQFKRLILFLKTWAYQTITYETKDKFIIYGYLLPGLEILKEIIIIGEIFKDLDFEYSLFIDNNNLIQSNLSLYNLPFSGYYNEESTSWNLPKIKLPLSIEEKNSLMISLMNQEMNF